MPKLDNVNIRPGVKFLSVLKHLNYKPYYAIAEFVDNAIDSYLKNKERLRKVEGEGYELTVKIEFDTTNDRITIRDNAAGICAQDYQRAFRAAEIPPDNSKLSEFGMGMKSAACWFSSSWEVRTTAFGEDIERTVRFDVADIVNEGLEELIIQGKPANLDAHYTVITLSGVGKKMPVKNGQAKVKKHLASIYRQFIRDGILCLMVKSEALVHAEPKILEAPYFENPKSKPILWKQKVSYQLDDDLRVEGFVALMETMSAANSGFALFRRGRVIEGSADKGEGFRPAVISGSLGSHRYKRLYGELHLTGFEVSHTKDGFQWGDFQDEFLDLLKKELESDESLPILKQADRYRVRESKKNYDSVSKSVVTSTASSIEKGMPHDIDEIRSRDHEETPEESFSETKESYYEKFKLTLNDCEWMVHLEVSYDESIFDFFQVGDHLVPEAPEPTGFRNIGVRLSLIHPFMIQFAGDNRNVIEPILRIAVAFGLGEVIARETRSSVSEVRNIVNELLSGSLAKP